jgi:hypothetical protein
MLLSSLFQLKNLETPLAFHPTEPGGGWPRLGTEVARGGTFRSAGRCRSIPKRALKA